MKRFAAFASILAVAIFLALGSLVFFQSLAGNSDEDRSQLVVLSDIDQLRNRFNDDVGKTCLVLLLSPT